MFHHVKIKEMLWPRKHSSLRRLRYNVSKIRLKISRRNKRQRLLIKAQTSSKMLQFRRNENTHSKININN